VVVSELAREPVSQRLRDASTERSEWKATSVTAASDAVPATEVLEEARAVTVLPHRAPAAPVPEGVARVLHDGAPALFVSPHLDDAVLSCAALMRAMVAHAPVTVVTLFSAAAPGPHTRAARTFLRQCARGLGGATEWSTLFRERCREDIAVLDGLGAHWVHLGHPDALFRRRRDPSGLLGRAGKLLPELDHRYPTFRFDIALGRVSRGDRELRETVTAEVADLARGSVVFAPLGVGRHVDHLLARAVGEHLGPCSTPTSRTPSAIPPPRRWPRAGGGHGRGRTTSTPSARRSRATGRRSTRCSRAGRSPCGPRPTTRRTRRPAEPSPAPHSASPPDRQAVFCISADTAPVRMQNTACPDGGLAPAAQPRARAPDAPARGAAARTGAGRSRSRRSARTGAGRTHVSTWPPSTLAR
jgi:LmbE family N-acetylglucosaminyl deacetylase